MSSVFRVSAAAGLVAGVVFVATPVEAVVVPDLLYYRMDEASWSGVAGEVSDSSGAGHHGTAAGNATTVLDRYLGSQWGRAGSFDGNGDYVNATDATTLNPANQITLEARINLSSVYNNTIDPDGWKYDRTIIGRANAYYFSVLPGGQLGFNLKAGPYRHLKVDLGTLDMNDYLGEWVHVAGTYDGNDQIVYFNGEEVARESWSANLSAITALTRIGHVDYTRYFHGRMDEVGIYSYALTAEQVAERAAFRGPDVVDYRMNEPSWSGPAPQVTDSSGAGNHGTAQGGVQSVVTTRGRAGFFDGTDDRIAIGNVIPEHALTLEAWINPTAIQTGGWQNSSVVIGKSQGYILEISTAGELQFHLAGSGLSTWLTVPLADLDMRDYIDQWVHVAATYDGAEKVVYFNGREMASESASGSLNSAAYSAYIGYIDQQRYFHGYIDDARIYSFALSSSEVWASYIPEPGSMTLLSLALVCLATRRRRQKLE